MTSFVAAQNPNNIFMTARDWINARLRTAGTVADQYLLALNPVHNIARGVGNVASEAVGAANPKKQQVSATQPKDGGSKTDMTGLLMAAGGIAALALVVLDD